jgi:hypothetical protein
MADMEESLQISMLRKYFVSTTHGLGLLLVAFLPNSAMNILWFVICTSAKKKWAGGFLPFQNIRTGGLSRSATAVEAFFLYGHFIRWEFIDKEPAQFRRLAWPKRRFRGDNRYCLPSILFDD